MFFLLTCESNDKEFMETLVDPHKLTSIRLVEDDGEYIIITEDLNNNCYSARFNSEAALRGRLKELLRILGTPISIADTMKITPKPGPTRAELSIKLDELIKKL